MFTSFRFAPGASLTAAIVAATCSAVALGSTGYIQTNLVASDPGTTAVVHDSQLINAWDLATSATSPFWVADNGNGLSTLYNTAGTKQALVVTIPNPAGGASAPTGAIFNSTAAFNSDLFIFATEGGTIAGWRGALGTNAETLFDNSGSGAVYKGLAFGSTGGNNYLYAADFHNNQITVFGSPALVGSFTDPGLPAGYAPFNIQNISGSLYVTYAKQDAAQHDEVEGPGFGFVDEFDLNGNFVRRFASGGALNAPWGLALAPATFGTFASDLLVGNFGDGIINAFDPGTGAFLGQLDDPSATPISIDGLWALKFGNGGNGGLADQLYFTAGPSQESEGLLGTIAAPEPAALSMLALGAAGLIFRRRRAT